MSVNRSDSPKLRETLAGIPTEDKQPKLDTLRGLGISEEYLKMFAGVSIETTNNLIRVLGENPSLTEIETANNYLSLATLRYEQHAKDRVRGIVMNVANDNSPDINSKAA